LRGVLESSLGKILSEPKPSVFFDPPEDFLTKAEFAKKSSLHGLIASPKTRLTLTSKALYCNGEEFINASKTDKNFIKWSKFAQNRLFTPIECKSLFGNDSTALTQAYEAYACGWFELGSQ
jgi:50S ribosomal protein L16 3-hydroxylase